MHIGIVFLDGILTVCPGNSSKLQGRLHAVRIWKLKYTDVSSPDTCLGFFKVSFYTCILFCSYSRIIQSGKLVPFFSCYHESCQVSRIDGKKNHSKECPHRGHKPGYSNLYIMFHTIFQEQSKNISPHITVRFPWSVMASECPLGSHWLITVFISVWSVCECD